MEPLEVAAHYASIFEAIVVFVSLVFIGIQIRHSTKLANANNVQSLVNLSSPFNLLLAQNRELLEIWLRGSTQFDEMDKIDKTRYRFLLFHSMTLQEHIFYQRKEQLLDEPYYESWQRSFEVFFREHRLWLHWDAIKDFYEKDFADYLNSLVLRYESELKGD